ncbi:A disulfide reductase [Seminavis robusta]|uniref:A disulfide reductase n=1 Tax=Seminavis robusta TaxID=568900 RepID=A0A9N8HS25_9STRA|nr:A disulfide reductase [Seminavis robusta]|eukprot:Sro1468_g275180.1 A disulfide reductase (504) ;mRNA; r:6319-7830
MSESFCSCLAKKIYPSLRWGSEGTKSHKYLPRSTTIDSESDIPLKVVLLGGGIVSMVAALRIKELRPDYEVSVVVKDSFPSFSTGGIPFYLAGNVPGGHTSLAHHTKDEILARGVKLYLETTALSVNKEDKTVLLKDNTDSAEFELPFDKLVIGTGSRPVKPKVPGVDLPNVFFLKTISDMCSVEEHLKTGNPKSAVIVGGGYVGLEVSEALVAKGIQTAVVEKNSHILKTFDEQLGLIVQDKLEAHGVQVVHGKGAKSPVVSIEPNCQHEESKLLVKTAQGAIVQGDMVLVSVGATPNSDMFPGEKTSNGAIVVNKRCETSIPDVYAGGDVVQTHHFVTGKPVYFPNGTVAHKHGRIIAENICGMHVEYVGTILTQTMKLFDMVVTRTGLSQAEALAEGFDAATVQVKENDHNHYIPPYCMLEIRFTAEKTTGKILGIQVLGDCKAEVSKRVDIVAVAIMRGVTVDEFIQMDLSYTPPLSTPWDPVVSAAQAWQRQFVELVN